MENILEVNNLTFAYNKDHNVFENLQFSIKKETVSLILGSSSCGKTTLIRLLTGILPSNNNITVNGVSLNNKTVKDYMLLFGVVFSDDNYLFLTETVIDEIAYPLENLSYSKKEINERIQELVNLLQLDDCINKRTNELSSFEQVKVLIATSIAHHPKIIFLDNILEGLTNSEVQKIFTILNKIKKDISIVITSTSLDYILNFDEVVVLGNKKVLTTGTPKEVLTVDNELAKLGFAIPKMIDLSLKLAFYGVVDDVITDVDRMVDVLWK